MTAEDPSVEKKQPAAIGRPHKKPTVYAASRYMAQHNFDPLDKLMKLYEKVSGEIIWMEGLKNGSLVCKDGTVHKYSKMAHSTLLNTQQKLLNDLMRYGYSRIPETITVETQEMPRPVINLTPRSPSITVAKETQLTNIVDGEVVNKVT